MEREEAAMPMMAVSAATGALGAVLAKLTALLGDELYKLPEGSRSDAESMRSDLERVHSTLLSWIRGMGDADAAWKDDWMVEVREMSYDVEDAIDDLELSLEPTDDGDTAAASLEELKTKVKDVSDQFIGKWRPLVEQITEASPPSIDDHRARLFLHEDAAADQLLGMDKHMDELIKLLEQGADSSRDASRWRKGRPHLAISNGGPREKFVIKVAMTCVRDRLLAVETVAKIYGVISISILGPPGSEKLEVIGEGINPIVLITALRRKMGCAELVRVEYAELVRVEEMELTRPTAVSTAVGGFHEVKTVCILGFAGGGKTTLAKLLYNLATTEQQFEYRAFVSVSPGRIPNRMEILRDILRGEPTPPSAGNDIASEQDLIDRTTIFLVGKRYIVVIDDIWHWEAWEIIRKILPKNNLGSRIIVTTRLNSVAKKFLKDDDNDAFVYEIGALDSVDALLLSEKIVKKSLGGNTSTFLTVKDNPCYDLVDMCYGMPLALICMSSALPEQIQKQLGSGEMQKWKALRSVEEGILDIPSLKPLGESLSLDYNPLPLNLRTLLFYCSSVYHWGDEIERGRLVRMWIAEGFVSEEKAAHGYFGELVDREWIKQVGGSEYYEIHPAMLAFLRCKAQKYNFVTCLGLGSDILSSSTKARRLSLQRGCPVDCFSSMDLSRICSLFVLGRVTGIPFHRFQRLQVLNLEDNDEDMHDSLLQELCEKLSSLRLRYLGLKGTWISKLPQEMRKLKHLKVLYAGRTQISELPSEIGELQHLHTLDLRNTPISKLPPQIGKLKHLLTLDLSNTPISELPPQIGDLKHLHTLDLRNTQIRKLPPQIGELKHLMTLDLRNTRVRELPWQYGQISKSVRVLVGDVQKQDPWQFGQISAGDVQVQLPEGVSQALSNDIPEDWRGKCGEFLSIDILDRFEPPLVGIFKVPGTHIRIPELIKQHFDVLSCLDIRLCKLETDDHRHLADMPNLRTLVLRLEVPPRNVLHINGMGFAALESFRVDSRMPWITFQEGAMPKLKHLEFKFYSGLPSNHPVGITHLLNLQKVVFRCSKLYKSDALGIRATIDVVKKEAAELWKCNRKLIRLLVNGKDILVQAPKSSDIASSSGTSGVVDTEEPAHHNLPADQDGPDYKKNGILLDGSYAGSSGTTGVVETEERAHHNHPADRDRDEHKKKGILPAECCTCSSSQTREIELLYLS